MENWQLDTIQIETLIKYFYDVIFCSLEKVVYDLNKKENRF